MNHNQVIQAEFSKQAPKFGEQGLTVSSQELLDWILGCLPLEKEFHVLDVAAGTGHLSRAMAPRVRTVTAIDITPEMLAQARTETAQSNLTNVTFEDGNAEQLPYETGRFDFVATRLSIHHFETPIVQLREMVRVCKPNHAVAVIDLLAPDDEPIAQTYNFLERLRDPSHTVALSKARMEALLAEAGIAVEKVEIRDVEVDFERWARMTGTKPEVMQVIKDALTTDMNEGAKTGMRPYRRNEALKFLHTWAIFLGAKTSNVNRA